MRTASLRGVRVIGLGLALGSGAGCRDAPQPAPVPASGGDAKARRVDPAKVAERREQIDAMVGRCKAGQTCPPEGSAARAACEQVAAKPMDGARVQGLASDDEGEVAETRRYFEERLKDHEEAARPGGVTQTDDFADASAAARRELSQAEDAAAARAVVMRHLGELGRFQRWCTVGDATP